MAKNNYNQDGQPRPISDRFEASFLKDTTSDVIRITRTGLDKYRERFGKAGIDIRNIKTMSDFRKALKASEYIVMNEIWEIASKLKPLQEILESVFGSEDQSDPESDK